MLYTIKSMQYQTLSSRKHNSLRSHQNKGATLIVTVIITLIVATIATLTVKSILEAMSSENSKMNLEKATLQVKSLKNQILAELQSDPYSPFKTVLIGEATRKCLVDNLTYPAGSSWPGYCGTLWNYPSTTSKIKAELLPANSITGSYPSSSFILRVGYSDSLVTTGEEEVILPGGRSRPLLYSGSDLNLGNIQGGTLTSTVDGPIYSNGNITYSSTPNLASAYLESEGNIIGTLSNNSYYAIPAGGSNGSITLNNLRTIMPNMFTSDSARGLVNNLASIACPSNTSSNPINYSLNSQNYSSTLCINPGNYLITTAGGSVMVPNNTKATLLLPGATAAKTIDIYTYSASSYDPSSVPVNLGSSCASNCVTDALTYAMNSNHSGAIAFWSKLGTFNYPSNGLIGSTVTTNLGLCNGSYNGTTATGFLSSAGSCTTWSGSSQGVQIDTPFTIVVGNTSTPTDLYLSGPINSNGSAVVGAAVSGDVMLPYWARPNSTSYNLNMDISLISIGRTTSNDIRFFPSNAASVSNNYSGTLTLNGEFGGVNLSFGYLSNIFSGWKINTTSLTRYRFPPYLAMPNIYWYGDYTRKLDSSSLSNLFN